MAGKKNTPQYETRTGTPTTEQGDEIRILSTQARLPPHVQLDKDAFEAEERTLTLRRLRAQAEEAEAIADAAKGRASALAATREALSLEDSPGELSPQGLSVVSKHPGIDPKQIGLHCQEHVRTLEPLQASTRQPPGGQAGFDHHQHRGHRLGVKKGRRSSQGLRQQYQPVDGLLHDLHLNPLSIVRRTSP
jgi:hypothetical protein